MQRDAEHRCDAGTQPTSNPAETMHKLTNYWVLVFALLSGCHSSSPGRVAARYPEESAESSRVTAGCPLSHEDTTKLIRTRPRRGNFSLLIPQTAMSRRIREDRRGQSWYSDSILVTYSIERRRDHASPIPRIATDVVVCAEEIGGRKADIVIGYTRGLEEVQHVSAVWMLPDERRELRLFLTSPDSAQAGAMLAIVRSVTFSGEAPVRRDGGAASPSPRE